MKEKIIYLDKEYEETTEEAATYIVKLKINDKDETEEEEWSEVTEETK